MHVKDMLSNSKMTRCSATVSMWWIMPASVSNKGVSLVVNTIREAEITVWIIAGFNAASMILTDLCSSPSGRRPPFPAKSRLQQTGCLVGSETTMKERGGLWKAFRSIHTLTRNCICFLRRDSLTSWAAKNLGVWGNGYPPGKQARSKVSWKAH